MAVTIAMCDISKFRLVQSSDGDGISQPELTIQGYIMVHPFRKISKQNNVVHGQYLNLP